MLIPTLLSKKVIAGETLTKAEALLLAEIGPENLNELLSAAEKIKRAFRGNKVDLCALVNAKSGACPEDCRYCAQSSKNSASIRVFPFIGKKAILEQASKAKQGGVNRFAIVTSGRKPDKGELTEIAETLGEIKKLGLGTCASLGLLEKDELSYLKDHGLERLHNNLETSERFFPFICSSHNITDKIRTLETARSVGLSTCSGGIFGLGETWQDRIDLAFTLRELNAVSTPVNLLNPIKGTRLDHLPRLQPYEALKIIGIMRFILPCNEIRLCGGRVETLGDLHPMIFRAGADALMTGDYLVLHGRSFEDDRQMIKNLGLVINDL
jgi:biotin synthase